MFFTRLLFINMRNLSCSPVVQILLALKNSGGTDIYLLEYIRQLFCFCVDRSYLCHTCWNKYISRALPLSHMPYIWSAAAVMDSSCFYLFPGDEAYVFLRKALVWKRRVIRRLYYVRYQLPLPFSPLF